MYGLIGKITAVAGQRDAQIMSLTRHLIEPLRLGLVWMVLWATTGALLSIVVGIVDPPSIDPGEGPVALAKLLGGIGGASGIVFGLLLAGGERHRSVTDLSLLRAAAWGAAAGAVLPLLTGINDTVLASTMRAG